MQLAPRKFMSWLVLLWGVLGVVALLSQAIYRLAPLAWEPIRDGNLSTFQAALYAGWMVFSAYSEGYRGFQKRFCPKVVNRALYLANNPRPLYVLLAPAFCMALFHATKRGLITAWGISLSVVGLVILVRTFPQPWRGIIDGGVVLGLSWGIAALLYYLWVGVRGGVVEGADELPQSK